MDASEILQAEACCDVCGYPRRGLLPESLCPECGESPPVMVATGLDAQDVSQLTQSITQSQLCWLTSIAVGLLFFLIYSFAALRVTLIMPVGSFELGAMNFPGPKLNATTPIQRAIGGQPGEWGVAGSMAMLFQVAAIWLLTERRALRGDWERSFSIRFAARWVSILAAGGLLGAALSGAGDYIPPKGDGSGGLLMCAILLCELPANLLLYLHLRNLANQFGSKRAASLLRVCVWMVPLVTIGGAALIASDIFRDAAPGAWWHLVTGGYGAVAVATGAAATAAVLYLLATSLSAALGGWLSNAPQRLRRLPILLRQVVELINSNGPRWFIIVGLLLWISLLSSSASNALWQHGRTGFLGNVPMLNFIGPKVFVPIDLVVEYGDSTTIPTALLGLAAVWLMTVMPPDDSNKWLRRSTRCLATVAVAAPLGVQMGLWSTAADNSFLLAFAVSCCEIPATILLYLYLAEVAKGAGQSAKVLRWMCVAVQS